MKKVISSALALTLAFSIHAQTPCVDGMAGIYPCEHFDLLAYMPLSEIGGGENTNDVWGWVSPVTGREYALVGCSNGTAFVNISDPVNPIYLGILPTHTVNSLWRDVEAWNNYCFVGSEAQGHGVQVMNLLQLDQVTNPPVIFEEDAHYDGFGHSHTINIDPATGMLAAFGSSTFSGGPHLVDVSDPLNPALAGGFSEDGYTHDGYLLTYNGPDTDHTGKLIAVLCNEDALTIADLTNGTDPDELDSYSYPETGYVHQGWFTKDMRYFLVDDELDEMDFGVGTRTHIFDLNDLDNIVYLGFYESDNISIDHNLYILDQFVYESNYRSGVRALDAINVADGELYPIGYFDLYPANDFAQFSGTWSNYIYLPSGVNLATSMYDGFFITKQTMLYVDENEFTLCGDDQVIVTAHINADLQFPLYPALGGLGPVIISGSTVEEPGTYQYVISGLDNLSAGSYTGNLMFQTNSGGAYEIPLTFNLSSNAATSPVLTSPAQGASLSNSLNPVPFVWESQDGALSYLFELATDNAFDNLVESQVVFSPEFNFNGNLPNGTYFWRVRVTNSCGQGPWSGTYSFSVMTVGVEEWQASRFELMPNPADDAVVIQGSGLAGSLVEITDMSGRVCYRTLVTGQRLVVDLSAFEAGVYQVRVGNQVRKLMRK